MICGYCAKAADLLIDPKTSLRTKKMVKGHRKCVGGTRCDCQHRTPVTR